MTENPSGEPPIVVWFRRDLRCSDHPALSAAALTGRPVIPLFIVEDPATDPAPPGAAGAWWREQSLARLAPTMAALGAPLVLRQGEAGRVLLDMAAATGARSVFWSRIEEPAVRARDQALADTLGRAGLEVVTFAGALLFEIAPPRRPNDRMPLVFTPYWRRCLSLPPPSPPLPLPARLRPAPGMGDPGPSNEPALAALRPPDRPEGWEGVAAVWTPGEVAAGERLAEFVAEQVVDYRADRDRLDRPGTTRLSPYLHWGDIGCRQVWLAVARSLQSGSGDASRHALLRQLGWREFSTHLLNCHPDLPTRPLNPRFAAFPWRDDAQALAAWQEGRTGYPLVDAGMRQLRQTGWLHNRLRMVAASFLVKHLLVSWQTGAAWFMDTLADADLANNSANWQWVAGCGVDAAPFFRIFNPILQGQQFDPEGRLIRRFVPELAGLPPDAIHEPWRAPPGVLARAGVTLGVTYPHPIIDHHQARARALAALHNLGGSSGSRYSRS